VAQIRKVPNADGENRKWDLDMEKHPERLTDGDSPWVEARATRSRIEGKPKGATHPLRISLLVVMLPHRLGYRSRTRKPTCEHVLRRNTKLA